MKKRLIFPGLVLVTFLHIAYGQEVSYPGYSLNRDFARQERLTQASFYDVTTADPEPQSVGKAFLLSLLVPGTGEYMNGHKGYGRFFFGAELLLWGSVIANREYVDILRDEYRAFAVEHAGLSPSGKDPDFWNNIGKYDDLYSYNEQRRRERNINAIYPETGAYFWSWDSRSNRFVYDGRRISSNEIANRDTYFYAAIVLNHLVSGINAMRLARKHNRSLSYAPGGWNLRFYAVRETEYRHRFGFSFSTHF